MRLTDLQIRKLRIPETGQKTYFDEGLPGFGVRVSQGGTRSFVVMYGARRRLKTIGRYPTVSLADARREAKRIQSDLSLFHGATGTTLPDISFEQAKQKFLEDSASRNKPGTYEEYRRLLSRHFQFKKDLGEITRKDIMDVVSSSTAPSEGRHAYVAIRAMMNWCVRHGLISASPVPTITYRSKPRARVLSDDELKAVWKRAEEYGYPYGRIVQLLILTGQRRGEIAGLKWNWISDDEIVFPEGFTKNKREHRIPIGSITKRLLNELPEINENVFPSRSSKGTTFNGWSKSKRRFDSMISVPSYTLHDLRRTYSSNMARMGVQIHITEKLLNHVSGTVSGIAAVYNRYSYADEMRAAVEGFEQYIGELSASDKNLNALSGLGFSNHSLRV